MNSINYESSIFDRVMYSLTASLILIPGLGLIFYGFDKRSYNLPIAIISLLICSYIIFLLQRFFSYRILISDDVIQIIEYGNVLTIRFEDILEVHERKNACYIIDRIKTGDEYYIRGTKTPVRYKDVVDELKINVFKLPVIRRAYLKNYYDLIDTLANNDCMNGKLKRYQGKRKVKGKSFFISAALLKKTDYEQLQLLDIIKILYPYFMLLITFLMSLVEYGVLIKGNASHEIITYAKFIFPIFVVITIYILIVNNIEYIKKIMGKGLRESDISFRDVTVFLVLNILLSACIVVLFFSILNRVTV